MKKNVLFLAAGCAMMLTGCKKLGPLSADNFTVTPTPLEAVGGQVSATINGTFPEKYMKKKAQVTVTPVLKYQGAEAVGQSATFQGEKVQGNGTTILYKVGGNYAMKNNWKFVEDMLQSDLVLRFDAKVGKKSVTIPEVKVGYGVLATSTMLGRCLASSEGELAPDAFKRVIEQKQEANIKFLISQANLRTSELKSVGVQDLVKVLKEINDNAETRLLQSIEVSAYASPDGRYAFNEKLAERRQDASSSYLQKELKKIKMDANVNTKFTAEDWEGFQELISQSNLQDKNVILRVLGMYQDPEERERQIRNMSEIYTDIKEGILPELRRARLIVNYEIVGRSDEQIQAQYKEDASKLSVEEMLYGATLVSSPAEKEAWYQKTTQLYPSDYRAYNNIAQLAYQQGNIDKAKQFLAKAQNVNRSAAPVNANLALIALSEDNIQQAENYLAQASGTELFEELRSSLNVAKGNFAQTAGRPAGTNSNLTALTCLLNKDYAGAKNALSAVKNADATTNYLKAILAARTNDTATLSSSLRQAIQQDPTLAKRALVDAEFAQYAATVKALVK